MDIIMHPVDPKPAVFLATSQGDLAEFPKLVRQALGKRIQTLQFGGLPVSWKPMPAVGNGVAEIRVSVAGEHRVFFVTRFHEAIYILHAFEKKSQATPKHDIELGRARYRALVREREALARDLHRPR